MLINDIANAHKYYPLIELNWFNYVRSGTMTQFGFEGRDIINFGSRRVSGHDEITLAIGFRYKFSECIQIGTASEFEVTGRKDFFDYRFTLDMIFRY